MDLRRGYGKTFPEDPFETVKARIIGGNEGQVVGVQGAEGREVFG